MPKLKMGTLHPSAEEDAVITAAALSDPDAIPYTDAEWEAARPTNRRGRPPAAVTKQRITVRVSRDVVRGGSEGSEN